MVGCSVEYAFMRQEYELETTDHLKLTNGSSLLFTLIHYIHSLTIRTVFIYLGFGVRPTATVSGMKLRGYRHYDSALNLTRSHQPSVMIKLISMCAMMASSDCSHDG